MFGAADGQARRFNVPVVCDITEDSVNNALRSIESQLNDTVAPILKNFEEATGKPIKIRCGSAAARVVTCDDPLDWDSDETSTLTSGPSVYSNIAVSSGKSYFFGQGNAAGPVGTLDIYTMNEDTDLPESTTPTGTITGTEFLAGNNNTLFSSADERYVAHIKTLSGVSTLYIVDIQVPSSPALVGELELSESVASVPGKLWLARSPYILIGTNGAGSDLVLIVDVSNPEAPVEVASIPLAGSSLAVCNEIEISRDERTAYLYDNGAGVESWDLTFIESPTLGSFVSSALVCNSIAYNETDRWLFLADHQNSTTLRWKTVEISEGDPLTLSSLGDGNITGTFPTTDWTDFNILVGHKGAAAGLTGRGSGGNARFAVFNLEDLEDVTLEEDFAVDGLSSNFKYAKVIDSQRRAFNKVWAQLDAGFTVEIEVFEPNSKKFNIPCQLQISQIKFNAVDIPCVDQTVITGIPTGHPVISNLNANYLQGFEAADFSLSKHSHDLDQLSDVELSSTINDGDVLTYDTSTSEWTNTAIPGKALDDLTDVTITSVADNELLAYDNGSSEWINQTPAEAGVAAASHTHVEADITDLGNYAVVGHSHATSDITSGTFADARIAESNVTQHEGAIDHGSLTGLGDNDHTQYPLISGTPADNQVAVFTGAQGIEGATFLEIDTEPALTITGFLEIVGPAANAQFRLFVNDLSQEWRFSVNNSNDAFVIRDHTGGVNALTCFPNVAANALSIMAHGLTIGGTISPSAGTNALVLAQGTALSGMVSNTGAVQVKDVSGTAEVFAVDEAANATQLSAHNFELFEPDPNEPYPWSFYAANEYLGLEIGVDFAKLCRLVEQLTGEEIIHTREIPTRDWHQDQIEKVRKEKEQYQLWERQAEENPEEAGEAPHLPIVKRPPPFIERRLKVRERWDQRRHDKLASDLEAWKAERQ